VATRRRSRRKSISGNLTDIQKRIRYLETRPSAGRLASKAVATRNLALRAVEEDAVADNAIVRRSIAAAAVGTAEIENSSITTDLIATNAVTTNSIAPGAVTGSELAADSVTSDKIAAGAVGNSELGNNVVTTDKIADDSVTDEKIDGISGSKIIGGVQGSLIVDRTVTGTKLVASTITATELANNSVTEDRIALGAVTNTKIANGAVVTDKIFIQAVTESKLQLGGVSTIRIADGAVTASKLADGNVTNAKIQTGAVNTDKIAIGLISSSIYLADSVVTNAKVASISADKVTSGTFAEARIPTIPASKVSGLSNLLGTATVSGTGISRTFSTSGSFRSLDITINTGTGSNQLAVGNHTHTATGITAINAGSGISVSASGTTRTISVQPGVYSGVSHGHGRVDTSFAGSHVGHGGHTHFSNITSSIKLKKEISDYNIDIDKLFLLQPKRFKYKNQARLASKNREWDYGYIAEEALALGVEEIVGYDEKGEVDSINYGLLSVFVLEIVKKQQNDIDLLKQEIERLKEKI
jgi:hypothetical protein